MIHNCHKYSRFLLFILFGTVVYFRKGEYIKAHGVVSRIDVTARVLKVVQTKIPLEDILEVTGEHIEESAPGC